MRQPCKKLGPILAAVVLVLAPLAHANPPATAKRAKIGEVFGKPVYRDELRPKYPSPTEEDELHRLFLDPVLQKYCAAHRAELEPTPAELAAVEVLLEKESKEQPLQRVAEIRKSLQLVDKELMKKDSEFNREYLVQKNHEMQEMLKEELAAKPVDPLNRNPFADELKEINDRLAKTDLTLLERISLVFEKWAYEKDAAHPYRTFTAFLFSNWKMQRHFYDHFGGGRVLWQQAGLEAFDAYRRWIETEERKGNFKITDPKLRATFYHYWKRNDDFFITDPNDLRKAFLEPDWVPRPAPR
jgi:hypothetical protein